MRESGCHGPTLEILLPCYHIIWLRYARRRGFAGQWCCCNFTDEASDSNKSIFGPLCRYRNETLQIGVDHYFWRVSACNEKTSFKATPKAVQMIETAAEPEWRSQSSQPTVQVLMKINACRHLNRATLPVDRVDLAAHATIDVGFHVCTIAPPRPQFTTMFWYNKNVRKRCLTEVGIVSLFSILNNRSLLSGGMKSCILGTHGFANRPFCHCLYLFVSRWKLICFYECDETSSQWIFWYLLLLLMNTCCFHFFSTLQCCGIFCFFRQCRKGHDCTMSSIVPMRCSGIHHL